MRAQIRIGRLFGVEIGLHYSWLAIAAVLTLSLGDSFAAAHPDWGLEAAWLAALLTAALFFVSLTAHELAHAVVANARGVPVKAITLFALGGVAQMEHEPADAGSEFRIAVVGPLASFAIGLASLGAAWALGWPLLGEPDEAPLAVLVWLGYINLSLGAFNLLPGFPLDGGRILRALVWRVTGDARRSMRVASLAGRVVAVALIAFGLVRFASTSDAGGLWMCLVGWFLLEAARSSYLQFRIAETLRDVRVGELMNRDCPAVDRFTNLAAFLEERMARQAQFCSVVLENGLPAGLIAARDVQPIPRPQWPYRTVGDVMRPLEDSPAIAPDAPLSDALERMGRENVNQLAVAADGRFEGVLSRASVMGFLQQRLWGHP